MRKGAFILVLWLVGCGPAIADHDDFRRIQRAEASVAEGVYIATDDKRTCEERCNGRHKACISSESVCDIADDTDDKDALARCQRTERECNAAALRTKPDCDC